jgi:hypothetical protein
VGRKALESKSAEILAVDRQSAAKAKRVTEIATYFSNEK